MNGSVPKLGPRASGEGVRLLHRSLLRVGFTIAIDELVDARYGPTTRQAVLGFQRDHELTPTGTVDGATADALGALSAESPTMRQIVGRVRWADGTAAAGLTVLAFDRDLRSEQALGEAVTDARGGYLITYSADRFARAEKASADLFVRVFTDRRVVVHDPSLEEVLFNAPELAVIDVDLKIIEGTARSEYERILAAVLPVLDEVPLDGLRQDAAAQDVTFLAGETGFSAAALAHFGVAQKLASSHKLPADFFYALFAEETLLRAGVSGAVGARFGIDLNTELTPLFYDIVLLDEQTIRDAVREAISDGFVGEDLSNELDRIIETLAGVRPEAERYVANERPKMLFATVEQFLAAGAHERVMRILAEDADGDLPRLFTRLADVGAFTDRPAADAATRQAMTATKLADVLGYDQEIIERIRQHQDVGQPGDVRGLARLNPAAWRVVLRDATADVRVAGEPIRADLIDQHASALARRLEARYPTTAFAAQLERSSDALGGHRDAVAELLNANPDFDLATGNVEQLLRDVAGRPAVAGARGGADFSAARDTLKATQRIFKISPTYRQTQALLGASVSSAAKIHAMGPTRFITTAVDSGAFTRAEAEAVYGKAADQHTASALLAGQMQGAAAAAQLLALGGGSQPAADLQAVTADFPNLKSLFQLGDACFCEECRSVHSAAAYLADTLQFLRNRLVSDTTVPGPALKQAKDVLFGRRPDLGDLDLSCANTNTALPYIDLVCELLEDAVAPDPGFAFTGPVGSGADPVQPPSPVLLAALQAQGWPFTERSLVYEADLSGSRVVRDTDVVAKLTPDGGGGWVLRRLRQTVGSAAELAAAPAYVNAAAYQALAASSYAFGLPYDLAHQETRSYLAQFDVSRADLMRALQLPGDPADEAIAAEELGLSDAERMLVVTANPSGQSQIWNTGPLAALGGIAQVDNFLTRSGLDYRQLGELLDLAWVNPNNAMFVKHLDGGCDLSHKLVENLDDDALDRVHRYLRLWRATGWSMEVLERVIRAPRLGQTAIDDRCLVTLAQLGHVRQGLGLTIDEVVNLYDPLPATSQRYAELFLNPAVNGPIDDAFLPPNVQANELAEIATPGSGEKLAAHQAYLSTCLGLTTPDAELLVAHLGAGAIVSFANITAVYAATVLMRRLRLGASDLVIVRALTGVDPLASPTDTMEFAARASSVTAAAIRPADLRYLLRHEADNLTDFEPAESKLTAVLTALRDGYQAAYAHTRPAIDLTAPPEENKSGLRAGLSQLPGIGENELVRFESIVDGTWIDPVMLPGQFVDETLGGYVDTTAIQASIVVNPTDTQRNAMMAAITAAVAGHLYTLAKNDLATASVAAMYGLSEDATTTVLSVGRLRQPPALGSPTLLGVLTDDAFVDKVGDPPSPRPVTPASFDAQYRALRLLDVLTTLLASLRVPDAGLGWLLTNAPALGWLAPDALPYQSGGSAVSFESWQRLAAGVELVRAYPPVANPADTAKPWSLPGLFDLVLAPTTTAATVHAYLARLAGWNEAVLADVDARLGLSTVDLNPYRDPATIDRLAVAVGLLRRLGLGVADAVPVIQPVTTPAAAATVRRALKARYEDAEWPGVQQRVQDRLRTGKRDALVAFLLAVNPDLRDTNDLYDYFLIDVKMSPCMPTSRVVQAHATVQLFVQRCLTGLEPRSVASTTEDPSWSQWNWMANFRVWEANRKVFLYPENWILPELRDDKSELFVDLEQQLQQDELTDLAVENATIAYLEKLDELAHVDVMACYYQTDIHVMHVVARTKGGDPAVYQYRRFEQERYWTPWSRVPLDIAGDHLLAFDRNSRLTLAWPVFSEETETTATSTIPDPGSIPAGGQETEKPKKRWRIQLAVSERASGAWQPKKVSKGALLYPASGYTDDLPSAEEFNFFAYSLGGAGQAITCLADGVFIGSFSLTGCRGYPEPSQSSSGLGGLMLSPRFKDTEMLAERFAELVSRSDDDLAISNLLAASYQPIVNRTPGRFRVTYPMQVALIDWILLGLQLFWGGVTARATDRRERGLTLPLGTFMPYFYGDYQREYVIVPGFYERQRDREHGSAPTRRGIKKTYADIDQFVRDVLALLVKYLTLYTQDPNHDLQALINELVRDPEFIRLRDEFDVYRRLSYGLSFANFYHPLTCSLRTTLSTSGVSALMSRATQLTTTAFDFQTTYDPEPVVVTPYPVEDIDFDSDGAYAAYNWELFFHVPFQIAVRLNSDQRFAEARDWLHYIFNPVGVEESGGTPAPQKYWITKPFFQTTASDYLNRRINDILYAIAADPTGASITDLKFAVAQWRDKPFKPHVVARTRPVAYQLAIVVNYIKNLVDWGDQLFRQFTREAVTQATQLYVLADKLLGPKPSVVPPLVQPPVHTYNQLEAKLDLFGNALLDLENLIPDLGLLPHGGAELPSPLTFSSLYFCIPPNENLLRLWDTISDRLFKIRHCQNIDGEEAVLALFSPPIDPGALVRAAAAGLDVASFLNGLGAPPPAYRFRVMTQKASELVAHISTLGNELLAALEKRDAEKLARLRSGHEIAVLDKVRQVKLDGIEEARGAIEALNRSRLVVQERQTYYSSRPYMNAWEITATALSGASLLGEVAIGVGYILSGGLKLVPEFMSGGAGFGGSPTVTVTTGGEHFGDSAESAVRTLESLTRGLDKAAGMAATQASYRRRMDDWEHQAALAGRELNQIDQQLANARLHLTLLNDDLATHDKQAANAAQTDEFLHSKYTNQDLYEWMISQASAVYFSAYKLAFDVAKKAERCFNHELGADTTFLRPGYWDSLKKGLASANALQHDIKGMEVAYLDQNRREHELTKHISLAQLDPAALITLRATGSCVFTVPEAVFDLDHPGHYFRRLRAVSLSVPCVAGPYTSVSAKLSLISNRYRNSSAQHQGGATARDKYVEQPELGDERFAYNIGAIESIATSSGQNDSGLFELSFADDRYLPFEGKGAIGTWRLELPAALPQFDYDTISDVVLHLRYTARDAGSTLRTLVEESLREQLNAMLVDATHTGLYQAFSLRRHFPDQWWQLHQNGTTAFAIGRDQLPLFVRGHAPMIDAVVWYARLEANPSTYQLAVGGAPAVTLNRVDTLHQCVGPSAPLTLDTTVAVSANPAGLTDLTVLVHYTLNS